MSIRRDPKEFVSWLLRNLRCYFVMRVYWPEESALNGTWKPPAVQRVK